MAKRSMTQFEALPEHQALVDGMNTLALGRIAAATPIEVLSTRGDKLLQVVQEYDGRRFVTRSFTDEAVRNSEHGLDFRQAWDAMHEVFSGDGVAVVPSILLTAGGEYPFIAVSEHITDSIPVIEAPTSLKIKLATHLGGLLKPQSGYTPTLEMVNAGMFTVIKDDRGEYKALMVDVDPHITRMNMDKNHYLTDNINAHYIKKLGELFWNKWCREDEREEVLEALVRSIADAVLDDPDSTNTFAAFLEIHHMSQGLNPEQVV